MAGEDSSTLNDAEESFVEMPDGILAQITKKTNLDRRAFAKELKLLIKTYGDHCTLAEIS